MNIDTGELYELTQEEMNARKKEGERLLLVPKRDIEKVRAMSNGERIAYAKRVKNRRKARKRKQRAERKRRGRR